MLIVHIYVSVAESYQKQKSDVSHHPRNTTLPEANLSKPDWNKQRVQVLKLTCSIFHLIITGNKQTLVICLFNHFHAAPANNIQQIATATDTASIVSSIMAELITLKQDVADNRKSIVNSSPSPDIVAVAANESPFIP